MLNFYLWLSSFTETTTNPPQRHSAKWDIDWNKQWEICVKAALHEHKQPVSRGQNVKWGSLLSVYPGPIQAKVKHVRLSTGKRVHLTSKQARHSSLLCPLVETMSCSVGTAMIRPWKTVSADNRHIHQPYLRSSTSSCLESLAREKKVFIQEME